MSSSADHYEYTTEIVDVSGAQPKFLPKLSLPTRYKKPFFKGHYVDDVSSTPSLDDF